MERKEIFSLIIIINIIKEVNDISVEGLICIIIINKISFFSNLECNG